MISTSVLEEMVAARGYACAVAVDDAGAVTARAGDFAQQHFASLISALLGPRGSAKTTFESLKVQILPQIWTQGVAIAVLDRPFPGCVVAVFSTAPEIVTSSPNEATALYLWSREVAADLRHRVGAEPLP